MYNLTKNIYKIKKPNVNITLYNVNIIKTIPLNNVFQVIICLDRIERMLHKCSVHTKKHLGNL